MRDQFPIFTYRLRLTRPEAIALARALEHAAHRLELQRRGENLDDEALSFQIDTFQRAASDLRLAPSRKSRRKAEAEVETCE